MTYVIIGAGPAGRNGRGYLAQSGPRSRHRDDRLRARAALFTHGDPLCVDGH